MIKSNEKYDPPKIYRFVLIETFQVVGNLLKKPNAKAVVLFTRAEDAR